MHFSLKVHKSQDTGTSHSASWLCEIYSSNDGARLAFQTIFGLFQQGDEGLPSGRGFGKFDGSLHLGQHGTGCKLSFGTVLACLLRRHPVQPLLLRRTKMNRAFFHSRQNDEQVCIHLLCDQAGTEILIDYRTGAVELDALPVSPECHRRPRR